MKKFIKFFTVGFVILLLIFALTEVIYLKLLPDFVKSQLFNNLITDFTKKSFNAELVIEKPYLETHFNTLTKLRTEKIYLSKNNEKILDIEGLNTEIYLRKIIFKSIKIKRFSIESLYANINKLLSLCPKQEKKQEKKSNWNIDLSDALLYVRDTEIIYDISKDTHLKILSKGIGANNAIKQNRRIYFKFLVILNKNNHELKLGFWDQARVFENNKTLYINNLPLMINGSKIIVDGLLNKKLKYDIRILSNNFKLEHAVEFIDSNLFMKDSDKLLLMIAKQITGVFDINAHLSPKEIKCDVTVKRADMNITLLGNLPLHITDGILSIDTKNIIIKNFKGYYCNKKTNNMDINAEAIDYMKSMKLKLTANAVVNDTFMKNYLSKIVNYPLGMQGKADTRIMITSKNNKFDVLWLFKLLPDNDILVDGASFTPHKYERVLVTRLNFAGMLLKIKSIDYFITYFKDGIEKRKSIMNLFGDVDCNTGKVLTLGLNIPDPLPSEFFNLFVHQKMFKKGNIKGSFKYNNTGSVPKLEVNMKAEKIRVPSQRLSIKQGCITSDKNNIYIDAFGRYKKSAYKLKGAISNSLVLPVDIHNIDLSVDDMDIEKIIASMNKQNTEEVTSKKHAEDDNEEDESYVFNTGMLLIRDCNLNLSKAFYKDIQMGNLHAKLTLGKDGVLNVQSNKFDFAEGISTLKVICDLINHKYYVRLGVKDVNSDLIARTLLNFEKEISGKARGLIELNTDDSLKMNGKILFDIKDGTIGKIGLLEYVLKFTALFRNPLAMISPATLVDLVNIPEGNFEKIKGELYIKDNVINPIKITSSASGLSAFIIGSFDLQNRDAILRIYTKITSKHKGFAGFLRYLSLNALANRVPFNSINDKNYYALEINELPKLETADEKDCQIFLTRIDGDVEHNNFISSLKRIK